MKAILTLIASVAGVYAAPVTIGCIGDSITAGVCSQTTHGYPAVLQKLLGSGYQVTNFGNSGKTMLKYGGPGDSSYWNQTTWPSAQKANCDIYTILLGTNDAKTFNWFPCTGPPNGFGDCSWVGGDNYTADYLDMIAILKAQPAKPRVFVMSPPPLYPPFPYSMNKTVINGVLPWLLPQIAAGSAAEPSVIDLFDALGGANLTQPNITCDGCHPVDKGYTEMANVIYGVISNLREKEEPGWPAIAPGTATAAQMRVAEPRPEWNERHPELFGHREDFNPAAFHNIATSARRSHKRNGGWRIREV